MTIDDLGEFGLIDRIRGLLPESAADGGVIVGIGDDVAVLRSTADRVWLATCDVQVEGVHFIRERIDPRDLGWKSLAVNLSDIASAGGAPRFALVSLGLPSGLAVSFVDGLYTGLGEAASRHGAEIVGGNITRSRGALFVDLFLLGEARREEVMLRSGARPGDLVLVTGSVGDAAAGVALLLAPDRSTGEGYERVAALRRDRPSPRVSEGALIGSSRLATAMIDVSDGLADDLGHLCERSAVSARLYAAKLPVAEENRALSRELRRGRPTVDTGAGQTRAGQAAAEAAGDEGRAPRTGGEGAAAEWHLALHGGEDYELLFTAPPGAAERLAERVRRETGTPITIIGEILPAQERSELILPSGASVPLFGGGWDHFSRGGR